jgi:hypothetical protein
MPLISDGIWPVQPAFCALMYVIDIRLPKLVGSVLSNRQEVAAKYFRAVKALKVIGKPSIKVLRCRINSSNPTNLLISAGRVPAIEVD